MAIKLTTPGKNANRALAATRLMGHDKKYADTKNKLRFI